MKNDSNQHQEKEVITGTGGIENLQVEMFNGLSEIEQGILKKYNELTFDNKQEYFTDQFGRVKGTTGFFDIRFTKGLKDFASFDAQDGSVIDVCIATDGTRIESVGQDKSTNWIQGFVAGKRFSSPGVSYFDRNSGGEKRSKSYQKITSCSWDKECE